ALMDLGFAHLLMDDLDAARDAFEAANVLCDQLGNPLLRAYGTSKLGLLADAEERFGDALRLHMEARDLFASVGDAARPGYALSGIGACLAEDPAEQERAAVILTFAMGHEQLPPSYAYAARPALDRLEAELPPGQLAAAREAAAAATLEELERTALQPV